MQWFAAALPASTAATSSSSANTPWALFFAFAAGAVSTVLGVSLMLFVTRSGEQPLLAFAQPDDPPGVADRASSAGDGDAADVHALLSAGDAFARDGALHALVARSDRAQLLQLLRSSAARVGPAAESLQLQLLRRLALRDAEETLAVIGELHRALGGRAPDWIAALFDAWGRSDFDAAATQLLLLEGVERELAAEALLRLVIERGGNVDAYIDELPEAVPRMRLRAVAASEQAERDPRAAWQSARSAQDADRLRAVVATWARADGAAALAATAAIRAATLRGELREIVFATWSRREPNAALDAALALGENAAHRSARSAVLFSLGTQLGADGVQQLLQRLPAGARDAAIAPLLNGVLEQSPQLAWRLLRELDLPASLQAELRNSALQRIAALRLGDAITLANGLSDSNARDALLVHLGEQYAGNDDEVALQVFMEIDAPSLRERMRASLVARAQAARNDAP